MCASLHPTLLCLAMAFAVASRSASAPALEVELSPLSIEDISPDSLSAVSSGSVRAIKLVIKNVSPDAQRLVWGDFFYRSEGGQWLGGWWEPSLPYQSKLPELLGLTSSAVQIMAGDQVEYVLIDQWVESPEPMEYKFVCLALSPLGSGTMIESNTAAASPISLDKSGVEQATAGLSVALGKLLTAEESAPTSLPGQLGVTVDHRPLGLAELSKADNLKKEVAEWMDSVGSDSNRGFHAYRTEIVNNTPNQQRIVAAELSFLVEGKWISGHPMPALMSEEKLLESGFLETLSPSGNPKVEKLKNLWIPPGGRITFPSQWHPSLQDGDSLASRWRIVLVDETGSPMYAEGKTPEELPVLSLPPKDEGELESD
jgi:hypothetical protein